MIHSKSYDYNTNVSTTYLNDIHSTREQWQYVIRLDAFRIEEDEAHTFLEPILMPDAVSEHMTDSIMYLNILQNVIEIDCKMDRMHLKLFLSSTEYTSIYHCIVYSTKYTIYLSYGARTVCCTRYIKISRCVVRIYSEELSAKSPQLNARKLHFMYLYWLYTTTKHLRTYKQERRGVSFPIFIMYR